MVIELRSEATRRGRLVAMWLAYAVGVTNGAYARYWTRRRLARRSSSGLSNALDGWRWEDRGERGWWRVHDRLAIHDGPHWPSDRQAKR